MRPIRAQMGNDTEGSETDSMNDKLNVRTAWPRDCDDTLSDRLERRARGSGGRATAALQGHDP